MHGWVPLRQGSLKWAHIRPRHFTLTQVTDPAAPRATSTASDALFARLRRHDLIRPLILKDLVAQRVAGVTIPREDVQQALTTYRKQHRLEDDQALAEHLRDRGIGPSDLIWQLELPLRIREHCREHYLDKAEAHFLKRKQGLDQVVYSLIRVKDAYFARELYLRLLGEEASFADLASQYSEGAEKSTHGIIGPRSLQQAHPVLADKLRTATVGKVIEPFSIAEWWLIARLESHKPASFTPEVGAQMAFELFEESINEALTDKLRSLQANSSSANP